VCCIEGVEIMGQFEHRVERGVLRILDEPELGEHELSLLVPHFLEVSTGSNTRGINFFKEVINHLVEVVHDILFVDK
jgi:hypothetical protein